MRPNYQLDSKRRNLAAFMAGRLRAPSPIKTVKAMKPAKPTRLKRSKPRGETRY